MRSVNAEGAKGGRKVNLPGCGEAEETPALVPAQPDKQAGEALWEKYGAQRTIWSEKMLIALERGLKGRKWFSLIDKVARDGTLLLAWEKVRSNAGGCGVDGITIDRYEKTARKRLLVVKERLLSGEYQPKPVKRVRIPKPGSKETRPLGVPTVEDRVVQQALRMVIEPIFESLFAGHSYGFRPGRSCHDALRRVHGQLVGGQAHVVDIDIKGYFDAIDQKRLMELVRERIADGRVLELLEKFLQAGVLEDGVYTVNEEGTPQGGVISPLLANLYLNELDHLLAKSGHAVTRYADDMVILCGSAEEAELALDRVRNWMTQAQLSLHPEKTRIVDMNQKRASFDFLGYRFLHSGKGKMLRLVRPKSLAKLKESIRGKTRRCNGHSMEVIIQRINPVLRGWFEYFKQAFHTELREVDGWTRMRLRSIYRKRHGKRGRGRGNDHHKWPNRHFSQLGLFSLKEAKLEAISLHRGVKH
ncbi:MAG: group II intron reverse transcriptase/maturase [Opitutales bacterium]|nr:group II intron reverse transcriptase/maturase [Opitutales bacterium]